MMSRLFRRAPRLLQTHPAAYQPAMYQMTGIDYTPWPQPSDIADPPSWTRVHTSVEASKLRDALPKGITWVTAYEYEQNAGQLSAFEARGMSKAHFAKWSDIHYKLMDNADKYLVNNQDIDEYTAAQAWNRWNEEVDDHMAYFGHMMWRFQCFTEANLEIIPPGPLREELRYTSPCDMNPDVQDEIFRLRQEWLPPKYKYEPLPDPMRAARLSSGARGDLLKAIDAFEKDWSGKAATDLDRESVKYYCNVWRDTVNPTREISVDAINKESNLETLQSWFERVFADNGDDRLYLIAQRAATLRGDNKAKELASWCHGIMCRDPAAKSRAVDGIAQTASAPSAEEKEGAALPGDFHEIKDDASLKAFMTFYEGHWKRVLPIYCPADQKMYKLAWEKFASAVGALGANARGAEVRRAWWKAIAEAWAAAYPAKTTQYAPPLLPVRKDKHGTRFMLSMFGVLGATGTFDTTHDVDPDYLVDALCLLDLKKLSTDEIASIWKEYPGFGLKGKGADITPEQRQRLDAAGLNLGQLKAV